MTKTNEELKQIAVDLYDGKIFCDKSFSSVKEMESLISMVFMPIGLGVLSKFDKKEVKDIGLIYEYYDQAGPRAINGYPMFISCRYLNKKDTKTMFDIYTEYKTLKEKFLKTKE